jgi:hypothetical protein
MTVQQSRDLERTIAQLRELAEQAIGKCTRCDHVLEDGDDELIDGLCAECLEDETQAIDAELAGKPWSDWLTVSTDVDVQGDGADCLAELSF